MDKSVFFPKLIFCFTRITEVKWAVNAISCFMHLKKGTAAKTGCLIMRAIERVENTHEKLIYIAESITLQVDLRENVKRHTICPL